MAGKFDGKQSVKSSTTVSNNLTELDNLLAELGSSPFVVDAADRQPDNRMITVSFFVYILLSVIVSYLSSFFPVDSCDFDTSLALLSVLWRHP